MSVRLFHTTEFSESVLLSPVAERHARHPIAVVLAVSLWLASVCNIALWQALSRLPNLGSGTVWWIGISLALLMACALSMVLSLLSWRWTLRLPVTLLLLLAAVNAHFMLTQGIFMNASMIQQILQNPGVQLRALLGWPLFVTVMLLGVLPAFWLWYMPVRRTPLLRNLLQNIALFATSCIVLTGLWLYSQPMLSSLMNNQPQIRQLLNPFSVLQPLMSMLAPALPSSV